MVVTVGESLYWILPSCAAVTLRLWSLWSNGKTPKLKSIPKASSKSNSHKLGCSCRECGAITFPPKVVDLSKNLNASEQAWQEVRRINIEAGVWEK